MFFKIFFGNKWGNGKYRKVLRKKWVDRSTIFENFFLTKARVLSRTVFVNQYDSHTLKGVLNIKSNNWTIKTRKRSADIKSSCANTWGSTPNAHVDGFYCRFLWSNNTYFLSWVNRAFLIIFKLSQCTKKRISFKLEYADFVIRCMYFAVAFSIALKKTNINKQINRMQK